MRAEPLKLSQGLKKGVALNGRNDFILPVSHNCKQTGVISKIHLHFSGGIIYCLSLITSFVIPDSVKPDLMWHMCACVCSCLTSLRTVYIVDIYIKYDYFFLNQKVTLLLALWTMTHNPLLFPHPWGKVVGSGKTADECFLKVPLSFHSFHGPTPNLFVFVFFPTVPCSICCEKDTASLLRSNQKGK